MVSATELDGILASVHPELRKWASIAVVQGSGASSTVSWHHYGASAEANDFWPASTIKLYAVIAAYELLNELGVSGDVVLCFERKTDGDWVLDAARSMSEMVSEVFRRSSNEDYTLLLRFVGIDRINRDFLKPDRGFLRSALMRGYVLGRPYEYRREESQRVTVIELGTGVRRVVEHTWSGISYSQARGATVISETTGNCTTTRELVECLRRLLMHSVLPEGERYRLTAAQVHGLTQGVGGLVGLKNRLAGAYAWEGVGEAAFPGADHYHKSGQISTYCLDLAAFDDLESGYLLLMALAVESGEPDGVRAMAKAIAQWACGRAKQI